MKLAGLLANAVAGASFLQSQYYNSYYCASVPDSLYIFTVANPNSKSHPVDESWPVIYSLQTNGWGGVYPFKSSCGQAPAPLSSNGECCCASMDGVGVNNYQSGISHWLASTSDIHSQFPAAANGQTYCDLSAADSSSLYGYQRIFYLASGGCIDGNTTCTVSNGVGTLTVYPDGAQCSGTALTTLSISSSPIAFGVQPGVGSVNGQLTTVNNGTKFVEWTTQLPTGRVLSSPKSAPEKFGYACYVMSIVFSGAAFLWAAKRYYEKRKWFWLCSLISQALWVAFCIDSLIFNTTQWYPQSVFINQNLINKLLMNLSSLSTMGITYVYMMVIVVPRPNIYMQLGYWAVILGLHLTFVGGSYIQWWFYPNFPNWLINWLNWKIYLPYSQFLFDLLPTLFFLNYIMHHFDIPLIRRFPVLHKADRFYIPVIVLDLAITIIFWVVQAVVVATNMLGSDGSRTLFSGFIPFVESLHCCCTIYIGSSAPKVFDYVRSWTNKYSSSAFGMSTSEATN
ncbi:hypothetical protein HDU91_006595, partial [Kappamyces sp. JEL0680]